MKWRYRWGVIYIGKHTWGGKPGIWLHRGWWIVGWRIGPRGWLVMPLHRLAEKWQYLVAEPWDAGRTSYECWRTG